MKLKRPITSQRGVQWAVRWWVYLEVFYYRPWLNLLYGDFFAVNIRLSACWEGFFHFRCVCWIFFLNPPPPPSQGKVIWWRLLKFRRDLKIFLFFFSGLELVSSNLVVFIIQCKYIIILWWYLGIGSYLTRQYMIQREGRTLTSTVPLNTLELLLCWCTVK